MSKPLFSSRDQCPVCLSADVSVALSEPYVGGGPETILRPKYDRVARPVPYEERLAGLDYTILACRDCSALFQQLAPTDEFAGEYYSSWIAQHGRPNYPFGEYTHHMQEAMIVTSFLLKRTEKSSPDDLAILDFGVGRGVFAAAMKACGCRVHAYDISTGRMESIRSEGITPVAYDDIPAHSFDYINTEQVFEHLPAPIETAGHLVSGLAPHGVLKISVPYARWLEKAPLRIDWRVTNYARNSHIPLQPIEHLTYFHRPSLVRMMARFGFSPVELSWLTELNFAFDWTSVRTIAKNLARPFVRNRIRNYYLFGREA